MQLHKDLFNFACVIQREVWVDSDRFWNDLIELPLYLLICLILFLGQLTAELDNQVREVRILKELCGHSLD